MTIAQTAPDRVERLARPVTLAIGLASLGLVLVHYFGGRALWLDEAMIALNLKHLSWIELAGKLEHAQFAPLGWLYLQKAILIVTSNYEFGLRALSVAAWATSLLLFRRTCLFMLSPFSAIIGFALFAFVASMARYAVEVKPYELDLLVGVATLELFRIFRTNEPLKPAAWVGIAALGLFSVLFTFGGVLALAAGVLASIVHLAIARRFPAAAGLTILSVAWFAAFLALMYLVYRPQLGGSELTTGGAHSFFTRTSFAPAPTSLDHIAWYGRWLKEFLSFAFTERSAIVAGVATAVGLALLAAKDRVLLLAALGPVLVGLGASAMQTYPMFDRLTLFCLPGLILSAACGFDWLEGGVVRGRVAAGALAAAAGAGSLIWLGGQLRIDPPFARHEIRPALAAAAAQARPGDILYVQNTAIPSYEIYGARYDLKDRKIVEGRSTKVTWPCALQELPKLTAGQTVWVAMVYNDETLLPGRELLETLALAGLTAETQTVVDKNSALLVKIEITGRDAERGPWRASDCRDPTGANSFDVPARWRAGGVSEGVSRGEVVSSTKLRPAS